MSNDCQYNPHSVYFIKSESAKAKFEPVKIGYTKDINSRLRALQAGNHCELVVAFSMEVPNEKFARKLESFLHKQLRRCNIRGEWFNLHNKYIKGLIDKFYSSHKEWIDKNHPTAL